MNRADIYKNIIEVYKKAVTKIEEGYDFDGTFDEMLVDLYRERSRLQDANLEPSEYIKEVLKTESASIEDIKERLSYTNVIRLLHAAMGCATEAGEFVDAIKKHLYYGKELDRINIKEEIGDMLWYIAIALDVLNLSFEEVMQTNIHKLRKRYGKKFDKDRSLKRDLKKERTVLERKENETKKAKEDTEVRKMWKRL